MTRYYVLMMPSGRSEETFPLHNGRLYATRKLAHAAADRYSRRTGAVRIDTVDSRNPAPTSNDAREWDAWRNRQGYSGSHH